MANNFNPLVIKSKIFETEDAVSLTFDVPAELKELYQFKAGQYLNLSFTLDGEEARRAYSICSSPLENELKVAVKRLESGLVSNHIFNKVEEGQTVSVGPPEGNFLEKSDPEKSRNIYVFAAGSGITPIISIVKHFLEVEPLSKVHMFYGNRSKESIIFNDELNQMANKFSGQFILDLAISSLPEKKKGMFSFFSKSPSEGGEWSGRVDNKNLKKYFKNKDGITANDIAYVCGPGDMIKNTMDFLLENGFQKKAVMREFFGDSTDSEIQVSTETQNATVTVQLNGEKFDIEVEEKISILDTLIKQKKDPPYSCCSGACSTCMAKLISGTVHMEMCLALDEEEIEDGYILTCQSHPTSDKVEISYEV